jgi:hypothetical protein
MNRKTSTAAALTALVLAGCSGGTTDTTGVDSSLETPTTEFTATTAFTDTSLTTDTSITTDTSSTTISGDAGTTDIAGVITDLQTRFSDFGDTLSSSGLEGDLGEAWTQAQGDLGQLLSDVQAGETLDMDAVDQALDDFESQLSGADESVQTAWDELRSALETALAQIEMSS